MLQNVLLGAQKILKEAHQKLPVEATDDIKQVYSEITKLNTYLNKEVDTAEKNTELDEKAKRDARRKILEKTGRKLEVLKARRNYSDLGRELETKLLDASEKDEDSIVKFLREREIRDRLLGMTEAQILSHFGKSLFEGSNLLLLDAILNAPFGFEMVQESTLEKLRLVRAKKKSPEIAVELETVRELNSMIEEMFSLAKKELDCLRKKELPLSILHGCEKDIQNNHKSL
jgi:hypothetical protein